jgi:nitroimidazol reductase NimA-like FMN-containing flavoprotein (pyridoxamine 5'-phosphate oxidase superfamily)
MDDSARELLPHGYAGRLGTVGADGFPYVVHLLYIVLDDRIWVHNTRARGHLRTNVDFEPRVCFEIDEAGDGRDALARGP